MLAIDRQGVIVQVMQVHDKRERRLATSPLSVLRRAWPARPRGRKQDGKTLTITGYDTKKKL